MPNVCFVVQPFDGAKFDKRFKDIFKPSIEKSGFEAYRVDRDPSVSIPIETIQSQIQNASACFVDITTDNPNVWFELGLAIAFAKPLCLVCSKERTTKYPFDIQHRAIISYSTDSNSDFDELSVSIVARLASILKLEDARIELPSKPLLPDSEGLDAYERTCLAVLAAEMNGLEGGVTNWTVKNSMENAGLNNVATNVALYTLSGKGFINSSQKSDQDGDLYEVYNLNPSGWSWIKKNLGQFNLQKSEAKKSRSLSFDEEVPF